MQLLHIDSSILGDSASRELSAAIVAELRTRHAFDQLAYRDVAADAIAHLDGGIAAGFRPIAGHNAAAVAPHPEHARSDLLVRELLASEWIVIGAPMYNFSIASQLKAWFDRVIQPGMTFRYTENGPVGLAGGKRVIIASTRGGMYSAGAAAAMDFQEAYLRALFGFIGITSVTFVRAENLSRGTEARQQSLQAAQAAIAPAVQAALS